MWHSIFFMHILKAVDALLSSLWCLSPRLVASYLLFFGTPLVGTLPKGYVCVCVCLDFQFGGFPPQAAARHMLSLDHLCISQGRNWKDPVRA